MPKPSRISTGVPNGLGNFHRIFQNTFRERASWLRHQGQSPPEPGTRRRFQGLNPNLFQLELLVEDAQVHCGAS